MRLFQFRYDIADRLGERRRDGGDREVGLLCRAPGEADDNQCGTDRVNGHGARHTWIARICRHNIGFHGELDAFACWAAARVRSNWLGSAPSTCGGGCAPGSVLAGGTS